MLRYLSVFRLAYSTITDIEGESCCWHRIAYWRAKISGNVERDSRNYAALKQDGWRVLVIWECDIKHNREDALLRLYSDVTQ